jgi:hypothetical protein
MPKAHFARSPGRFVAFAVGLLVVALVVGACASTAAASFDPASPCTADGRMAGAYPALEARIPSTIARTARTSLDSGRNCTAQNLGALAGHGVTEVRFAGGIWKDAAQSGLTLAVFEATGLQAEWIGEWYELPARSSRVTGAINTTRPMLDGRQAYRMDLINGESRQSVIAWPAASGDVVNVVIAADEPEERIQQAIGALK